MWNIGVDEAGRGPVIGPLVVAVFACPEKDLQLLIDAGIQDSKQLSRQRRAVLETWLLAESKKRNWLIKIHESSPAAIDNAMQRSNLNQHERDIFAHLINQILPDDSSGIIRLDACDVNEQRFGEQVCEQLDVWPLEGWTVDSRHGADELFPEVGAASILAKEWRDRAIAELSLDKNIALGSGYPSDPVTREAVRKLIVDGVPDEVLRWRWKTTADISQEMFGHPPPTRPSIDGDGPEPAQRTLF